VTFSSKGFVTSAEKACRRLAICSCISGMGHEGATVSKMRMWRTKNSRASLFNSGSGQVMAT
jgi:hypothetical protein